MISYRAVIECSGLTVIHADTCYLQKKQVLLLEKYILRWWTNNANVEFIHELLAGLSVEDGSSQSLMTRHLLLLHKISLLVDHASLIDAYNTFLLDEFESLHIRLKDIDNNKNIGMSKNMSKIHKEI